MNTLHMIFAILAILCFIGAAAGKSFGSIQLTPAGLVFLAAAILFV